MGLTSTWSFKFMAGTSLISQEFRKVGDLNYLFGIQRHSSQTLRQSSARVGSLMGFVAKLIPEILLSVF